MYRIIRQSEVAAPEMLRYHYEQIARGYAGGLARAAERGEVTTLDPEVTAYALMGLGELVGMKWILWGDGEALPERVWAELERIITCILRVEAP